MISILHVVNWYPCHANLHEAPFVREHFAATNGLIDQQLWHVGVRSNNVFFKINWGQYSKNERYILISTCIKQSRIIELLTACLLVILRARLMGQHWDLANIHIAYPLLRFPRLIQWLFGKKLLITEHWSAYRRNFNLPEGSSGKKRLQHMFHQGIPVLAVSQALMQDIINFAKKNDFKKYVIPNVVDPLIFLPNVPGKNKKNTFLMIANWAPIKRPMLVLGVLNELVLNCPDIHLKIIGHGPQSKAMQDYVSNHNLAKYVTFLGSLSKPAIAQEMRQADALLHPSEYETFSVVCAEALCCGLPVIASNVGGIPEFVNESNGILVDNTQSAWIGALRQYIFRTEAWNRFSISKSASTLFSPETVGNQLAMAYTECCQGKSA